MRGAKMFVAAAILFLSAACSENTQEKGESLFEDLDPPTLNVLRGVYSATIDIPPAESVEIRVRFTDGSIIGASKCVRAGEPVVIATAEAGIDTGGLDAATGKVAIQELLMKRDTQTANGRLFVCEAGIAAATYDFKVEDDKLTLWIPGTKTERVFKKVGD